MSAVKRYWIGNLDGGQKTPVKSSEVDELRAVLGSHIDTLDEIEAEVKDFLDWTERANVNIPGYALSGLKSVLGVTK